MADDEIFEEERTEGIDDLEEPDLDAAELEDVDLEGDEFEDDALDGVDELAHDADQ